LPSDPQHFWLATSYLCWLAFLIISPGTFPSFRGKFCQPYLWLLRPLMLLSFRVLKQISPLLRLTFEQVQPIELFIFALPFLVVP